MAENVTEFEVAQPISRWTAYKYRLALAGTATLPLVGFASAAIDFSNITALIAAVTGLIPSFIDLVIAIAPLIVTIAIIGFIVKFFDRILQLLNF